MPYFEHSCFISDINECASEPCRNGGACADKVNGYICSCQQGYTGINCQTGNDYILLKIVFILFACIFFIEYSKNEGVVTNC
jgi:hypothetical protein